MSTVNLLIPLRTTGRNGFYIHSSAPTKQLFGYEMRVRIQRPYQYLELQRVSSDRAPEVLKKVRALLPWAALRLNFGIQCGEGELQVADNATFDGQFPTAYPANLTPSPARIEGNHRTEEGDTLLFSALVEASKLGALTAPVPRKELLVALEIFASVDFEGSANAQFLALISILEILADPAPRPQRCVDIIEDAMTRMIQEAQAAQDDPALALALTDMHKTASHWRRESIRSSIRRLGIDVSRAMGDQDPERAGKAAVSLYDKRSDVVHSGEAASLRDVAEARQIVREALAVGANCFHHIRERYPTN